MTSSNIPKVFWIIFNPMAKNPTMNSKWEW